jgi:DNA invertase Pin-like site-specific DNA recombinase
MTKNYGYARVSTREQNEGRQVAALMEQGVVRHDIFIDKQSGKDFDRPAYRRLVNRLKQGDTMFIKSIDRLGRNYGEILEEWWHITKDREAHIVVIDMPLLDTRQKERDLTGIFIADLVLQILSYFAQIEREFIRQRQAEGIAAAKARGVRFGRPPASRPDAFARLREQWLNHEVSARAAARELGVTHRTVMFWANEKYAGVAPAASSAALNG